MKLQREWRKVLFILPSVVGMFLFYLVPLLYCFFYSFSRRTGKFAFGGVVNYGSLIQSESFRMAFINTCSLLVLCLGVLLGITLILVYFLDASKRNFMCMVAFVLPMLLPPALVTQFIADFDWNAKRVLILIYVWKYLGFHVLLLKAMEVGMNPEWMDAAVLEHASKWQVFYKIRMPYLWPYLRFLIMFDTVCFFRLFRESYLIYGRYPENEAYTIINFFFNNFQNMNYQRLSAAAILTLIPLLLLNLLLCKVGGNHEMV